MIFAVEDTLEKVQNGTKTVTRRPVKKGDQFEHDGSKLVKIIRNGRTLWEVGKDYAVQPGRGEESVGRFRILSIEIDPNPGYMELTEAQREGFEDPEQFKAAWVEMYGDVALWRPAYRIEFEYMGEEGDGDSTREGDSARDEEGEET